MLFQTSAVPFVAGLCLALPVHLLMLLNGSVFGVSGFIHRALKRDKEALNGVFGLVIGGAIIGLLEQTSQRPLVDLRQTLAAGFLVGLGTKLSNGCTSGHTLCGLSRFSSRSIAATVTFFITAVITANVVHKNLPAAQSTIDRSLGPHGKEFLLLQTIPLGVLLLLYHLAPRLENGKEGHQPLSLPRCLAIFAASVEFALALRLSGLTDPAHVVSFLLLPFHPRFDASLAFIVLGAVPFVSLLYRYARGAEKPRLGGQWAIPKAGKIDAKLLAGAAVFGVGWGLGGICPGPGLLNLGRAIVTGTGLVYHLGWVAAVAVGGLYA